MTTHPLALYGEGDAVMGDSSAYPCGRCRASYAVIGPSLRFCWPEHGTATSEPGLSVEVTGHDLNFWQYPVRAFQTAGTPRGPPVSRASAFRFCREQGPVVSPERYSS